MTNKDLANVMYPNVTKTINDYEEIYKERNLEKGSIVTRFAPSPTGFVHMGSLLTAFIANKVASDTNGIFYLRIEDTDSKRSVLNGISGIISDLKNFDIIPDEGVISENNSIGNYGPYIQSERLDIYNTFAKFLVENDYAYPCFCSEEELNEIRKEEEDKKDRIGYYGKYARCRNMPINEKIRRIKNNEKYVLRLKSIGSYDEKVIINDLVRGKIEFPCNDIDHVLIKSDGIPVYHFAHVIDDHLMRSTHILRGEEWLSSTPLHIELFNKFDFPIPKYAHLGLVMKMDNGSRRKLSKRKDPESSVEYYHKLGIPINAVKLYLLTIANSNFEAWYDSNKDKPLSEFKLDFKKISASGTLFDIEKLYNISKNYISSLKAREVYDNLIIYLNEFDKDFYDIVTKHENYTVDVLNIERERKKPRKDYGSYSEIKDNIWYMYDELFNINSYDSITVKDNYNKDMLLDYINNYYNEEDNEEEWYNKLKDLAKKYNYASEVKEYKINSDNYNGHIGDICEFIRVVVTSKSQTPSLYEILKLLGNKRIFKRINMFIDYKL